MDKKYQENGRNIKQTSELLYDDLKSTSKIIQNIEEL